MNIEERLSNLNGVVLRLVVHHDDLGNSFIGIERLQIFSDICFAVVNGDDDVYKMKAYYSSIYAMRKTKKVDSVVRPFYLTSASSSLSVAEKRTEIERCRDF